MRKLSENDKSFAQGYICALTCIIYGHGIDTTVVDAYKASGYKFKDFDALGIEEYDKEIISANLNELERHG